MKQDFGCGSFLSLLDFVVLISKSAGLDDFLASSGSSDRKTKSKATSCLCVVGVVVFLLA